MFHQLYQTNLKLNNTIVACDIGPSVNTFFVFHIFRIESFKILVFNSADKYGSITTTKFQGLLLAFQYLVLVHLYVLQLQVFLLCQTSIQFYFVAFMQTNHLPKNLESLMKSLKFFKILGQHDFPGLNLF